MKLAISHATTYSYDAPVHYALQQLRLTPLTGQGQRVLQWASSIMGGAKQAAFDDLFANHTELIKIDPGATSVEIMIQGVVEVEDRHGIIGPNTGFAPLWLFQENTALTAPGNHIRQMAATLRAETEGMDDTTRLHQLSAEIAGRVTYEAGHTDAETTAEAALTAGHGVCQDHAHIMISVARQMGYPARYVSGYLFMDGQIAQDASHAWCEIWCEGLGWVGFDVSNGISPDARYVRVATGRDYRDAAPILGMRRGEGSEQLHVALQIQQ